jgi:hypothetical protein
LRARGTGAAVNRHRAALSKGVTVATVSESFLVATVSKAVTVSKVAAALEGWGGLQQNNGKWKKSPHQRTASKLATATQESEDQGTLERDPELSMTLVRNALPVVRCLVDGGCQSSQLLGFSCTISSTGGSSEHVLLLQELEVGLVLPTMRYLVSLVGCCQTRRLGHTTCQSCSPQGHGAAYLLYSPFTTSLHCCPRPPAYPCPFVALAPPHLASGPTTTHPTGQHTDYIIATYRQLFAFGHSVI